MRAENQSIDVLLSEEHENIIREWYAELAATNGLGSKRNVSEINAEQTDLLRGFQQAIREDGDATNFEQTAWSSVRDTLANLSRSRAAQGSSAGDTSAFVLGFKRPMFKALQRRLGSRPEQLVNSVWAVSSIVDKMAQWTVTTYQRTREEIITRQQHELLELSTPVVKLWDGVLAVPMIGTLDSSRTQLVMETLLQRIVDTGSQLAIIDITGVPTVDTLVAQHLLKTVAAIRLMGAECIVSGIRPQIAQTIVHLGIDLEGIITKSSLADALAVAMQMSGYVVTKAKS